MSIDLIQERLNTYQCQTVLETEDALREISQEIVLAGLSRTDFFKKVAFQGGTCLRILYGLNRFSEDLDFITRKPDASFELAPFLNVVAEELKAYGYELKIVDRSKVDATVKKAFLKDDSLGKVLSIQKFKADRLMRKIKIKLEVDTNPPEGGVFESKFHDFPFAYSLTVQDLPTLFAGKVHALLCRKYVKGRDWYDFIWYMARKTKINFSFLSSALDQQGPWQHKKPKTNLAWCEKELIKKISSLDWKAATNDVKRFINQRELDSLKVWSKEFFIDRLNKYMS